MLGEDFFQATLRLDESAADLRLHGFVAQPGYSRSTRDVQYFYVNGRFVRDRLLAHAVRQAYQYILHHERQPAYLLALDLPPAGVISIACGNEPLFLDPKDPYDRIKLHAIEAGGFGIVAKSFDDARSKAVPPKFYLDKEEETVMVRTEYKKWRNKALSELQKLFDKNSTKLFYIAKVVDINSTQYRKTTPNDVIYENMDLSINGEGGETNKERAAKSFMEPANMTWKH